MHVLQCRWDRRRDAARRAIYVHGIIGFGGGSDESNTMQLRACDAELDNTGQPKLVNLFVIMRDEPTRWQFFCAINCALQLISPQKVRPAAGTAVVMSSMRECCGKLRSFYSCSTLRPTRPRLCWHSLRCWCPGTRKLSLKGRVPLSRSLFVAACPFLTQAWCTQQSLKPLNPINCFPAGTDARKVN